MSKTKAIIAIIVGSGAMVFQFTIKQFYAAKGMYGAVAGHPIPRWKGRLLFGVVGVVFLFVGFKYFFYDVFH